MGFLKFLGALSPFHINWVTFVSRAKTVGLDSAGNRYYTTPPRPGYRRDRRWVIYKGPPEASAVPPEWHGWLHHQSDQVPDSDTTSFRRDWQKPHRPNPTGTNTAYRPPGHLLEGGQRDAATGDYEAWRPPV